MFDYYLKGYKNAFNFVGRTNRKEFGYFFMFDFITLISFSLIDTIITLNQTVNQEDFYFFSTIWYLMGIVPRLSIGIRRLRDGGKSGWWTLFPFPLPFWQWVWTKPSVEFKPEENGKGTRNNSLNNENEIFYNKNKNNNNKDKDSSSKSKLLTLSEFVESKSAELKNKIPSVIEKTKEKKLGKKLDWKDNLSPDEKNFRWRNPGSNFESEEDFKKRYLSFSFSKKQTNTNSEKTIFLKQDSYKSIKDDPLGKELLFIKKMFDEKLINHQEYKKMKLKTLELKEYKSNTSKENRTGKDIRNAEMKEKLIKLRSLFDKDLIDKEEYDMLRKEILEI